MSSPRSTLRRLLLVAIAVTAAATWFTWLRPVALGGSASYVVVQGGSMEPTYEDGDLVLVREEAGYGTGDVIAFRAGGHFDDPTKIIHRIVGDAGDGAFRTQGDNRDRLDPWTPGPDDIIGKATLHIPMAGRAAGFLTRPQTFAALGGAAVIVGSERRRRRRRSRQPHGQETPTMKHLRRTQPTPSVPRSPIAAPSRAARFTQPRWAFVGLLVSCALAVPLLAITWSALRAPDSTQRLEAVGQLNAGIALDYRFVGAPSAVYPTGEVSASRSPTGAIVADAPLYSRLLDALEVRLAFQSDADGASDLASVYAVDVLVESPGGWSTTLKSIEPTPFEGSATQGVAVNLREVAERVAGVAELTGVGGDAYTVTVTPTLDLTGSSGAGQVQEQLAAPMTFAVENNLITANAIEASESKELTRTVAERATYEVGPVEMGTQAARGLLGGLTLVLVAAIVWFASVLFGGVGLGEPARIAARYRSQIIDVEEASAPPGPVVMVSAIDELARIAKVEQTVILHEDLGDGAHRYRVFLGTVTYEYETAPEHGGGVNDETAADVDETGG
jgi:signal peptidase I